jgi:AraC-like DNA-binding protein
MTKEYYLKNSRLSNYLVPQFIHFGTIRSQKQWSFRNHVQATHECIFIKKGAIRFQINDETFDANTGTCYCIMPGQRHQETSIRRPLLFYYLKFALADLRGTALTLVPPDFRAEKQVIANVAAEFGPLFDAMHAEAAAANVAAKEIIETMIVELVWRLKRRYGILPSLADPAFMKHYAIVERVQRYIATNLERKLTLEDLACEGGISTDYLGHVFRNITGVSPLVYASKMRMDEAKRLLREESLSVAEVARRLGFEYATYFSRKFKKLEKLSPDEYRRKPK